MDFKLVSKNNMGVVMSLILVVLLSQSRFFDFLMDTPLGRMVLLAFVILIAHTNKFLGLVAVLSIIIAFNHNEMNMVHGYNFYEGFEASGNTLTLNTPVKDEIQNKLQDKKAKVVANQTTTTTSTSNTETFKSREGFCMTDRETNMLRGKQSNAVPVFNNLREQSDDVSPSDKSVFSSDYASI
jgi:hypothetical protein